MFWVYILKCSDGSFYTGHTDGLERRVVEQQTGVYKACYTYSRRPVELVFQQGFETREQALNNERQIKGWSRAKKQALIQGDWSKVSRLAKSHSK